MATTPDLIERSPDVLAGTPVFAGTRVPVRTLIDECLPRRLKDELGNTKYAPFLTVAGGARKSVSCFPWRRANTTRS